MLLCSGADLAIECCKGGIVGSLTRNHCRDLAELDSELGTVNDCYAGALELVLACDFILADTSARFADTHGKWGFVSEWGMSQRLPRRVGAASAKRIMMTGLPVQAAEAKNIGLVDLLAPEGGLDARVSGFVADLLASSWHTSFAVRRLMGETDGMSLAEGLAQGRSCHPGHAPDHQECIARFNSPKAPR